MKQPETFRGIYLYFKRAIRMVLYFEKVRKARAENEAGSA